MKPIIEARGVGKTFATVIALRDIDLAVRPGEVTCILGDNGAGKSTLIKILAGVHAHSSGEFLIDDKPRKFSSPRDALDAGIATVYQDLAMVPLMSVWRNFFLGNEMVGLLGSLKIGEMKRMTREEMGSMGIDVRDVEQPVGTLSGGERQSVAIARAIHRGARVLILDEPTAALGVKQSGVVLKNIQAARERGIAVVFITHNPQHAYLVGDQFLVLNRGASLGTYTKADISLEELTHLMAGGAELEKLSEELGADAS
ncbi:sugar ABC transporter ATP-binding protein [Bowdeniella nasicola]|uniref:Sugar ABC transporter ATP-binding protein n=1 Tax=Bowdeniella nasicola TaxID=208480 RepID=A0A1Q5Q5T1_9ACTO|nr:ATP-binding cassette domain-containing protein [Bowdeniella nasicola]OKL54980.1 sugar ABC transporter ATP-binding protein [Bowdeniella nasicola]